MADTHRAMPVVVDGSALVVRPEPATASGRPLNHAEKTLHAMADRIEALEVRQVKLEAVAAEQAADDGLWFQAQTAPEAYLQQELRKLHEIIEGKTSVECAEKTLVQMFEEGRNRPHD